jgi:hypothetical protein
MIRIALPAHRKQFILQIAIGAAALLVWIAPVPRLESLSQTAPQPPAIPDLPSEENLPNMQQLIARPLFAQSRRPPPPVTVAPPLAAIVPVKPLPTTEGMILLGVLRNGSKAIALVTLPGDPVPREVSLGAALGAWIVTRISGDRISLKSGETNAQLVLPQPVASSQPSASAAAPGPAPGSRPFFPTSNFSAP